MGHRREEPVRTARRARRRRHRSRGALLEEAESTGELDRPRALRLGRRSRLTPEETAYRDARRRANAKIGFLIHLVAFTSVNALILFTAGFRPAFYTALAEAILDEEKASELDRFERWRAIEPVPIDEPRDMEA